MALLQICPQFILPNFKALCHMSAILWLGLFLSVESMFEYYQVLQQRADEGASIAPMAR